MNELETKIALLEQRVESKWALPRILATTAGAVLAISLGSQFFSGVQAYFTAERFRAQEQDFNKKLQELKAAEDRVEQKTTNNLKIATGLSDALAKLNSANSEYNDDSVDVAMATVEDILSSMKSLKLGVDSKSDLQSALNVVTFSALDLKAKCYFKLKMYATLDGVASEMITLESKNWLGHHYMGLYHYGRAFPNIDLDSRELILNFWETSVIHNGKANRDKVNIAELYLTMPASRTEFEVGRQSAADYYENASYPNRNKRIAEILKIILGYAAAQGAQEQDASDEMTRLIYDLGSVDSRFSKTEWRGLFDTDLLERLASFLEAPLVTSTNSQSEKYDYWKTTYGELSEEKRKTISKAVRALIKLVKDEKQHLTNADTNTLMKLPAETEAFNNFSDIAHLTTH